MNETQKTNPDAEPLVFTRRMEEAALTLRERELILSEARLQQQKTEWEHSCLSAGEERAEARQHKERESRWRAKMERVFVAFVPLFVALLPLAWGYAQYLAMMRGAAEANRQSARETARINAASERFKAVLDIKRDFFKRQDVVFEQILRVTGAINREVSRFDTADTVKETAQSRAYQKNEDEWERIYASSPAFVGSETASREMVLFHNALVYLRHPTEKNYQFLNKQWHDETSGEAAAGITNLPRSPAQTVGVLSREIAAVLQSEVQARTDPKQYPFIFAPDTDTSR